MSDFIFQCFCTRLPYPRRDRGHLRTGRCALAGMPRCARTVGYAHGRQPRDPSVPCHRVVDRFGGTKSCFDLYGPGTQRALLEAEGVVFTPEGAVDLARCPVEWYLLSKKTPADRCGARRLPSVGVFHITSVRQQTIHRRPVRPNGFAQRGDRLVPGIVFVALQRLPILKLRNEHGVIIAALHAPEDRQLFSSGITP